MKSVKLVLLSLIVILFTSCATFQKLANHSYSGIHQAKISYYNPLSGTYSNYLLNIEVSNNTLEKIYWNAGEFVDDSKFTPPKINKNGYCEFVSGNGFKYQVQIVEKQSLYKSEDDVEDANANYFDEDDLYWDEYPFIE